MKQDRMKQDAHAGQDADFSAEEESKTKRKQRMTGLQKLGEELLSLNKRQLEQIELPDTLWVALKEFERLPNRHEAKRRQLQYIGKLMRGADHEQIAAALEKLRTPDRQEVRRSQDIERWSTQLLQGEADDIEAFLQQFPAAERQTLRQLLRRYTDTAIKSDDTGQTDAAQQQHQAARRKVIDYVGSVIV